MKKYYCLFVSALLFNAFAHSQTTITAGYVSGQWSKSQSPYLITGDITIAGDSVLTIQPGVLVQFQGHYKLNVNGQLLAQGAYDDNIVFTIKDTTGLSVDSITDGGWGGIRFENNTSIDSSKIEYCTVQYGKAMYPDSCGGGIFVKNFSNLVIANSSISNNIVYGGKVEKTFENLYGGGIACINSSPAIINNIIVYNQVISGGFGNLDTMSDYWNYYFSTVSGGGIYCNNSSVLMNDNIITFNNIKAIPKWFNIGGYYADEGSAYGGGIALVNCLKPNIEGNTINDNACVSYFEINGCGIYCNNSGSSISENIIENNFGNYNISDSPNQIEGGGIYCSNSNSNITDNIIENNSASVGGGIYVSNKSNVLINKNFVKFNQSKGLYEFAAGMGGGIFIINSKADINNDTISYNSSIGVVGDDRYGDGMGGGVYIETSACKISYNNISSNEIKGGSELYNSDCGSCYGGGIYISGDSNFIINNNIISKNYRQGGCPDGYAQGGGIYVYGYNSKIPGQGKIINNYIENNMIGGSDNWNYGAGIYVDNSVLISNNVISNNFIPDWGYGAGIYCGTKNRLINNTICFNSFYVITLEGDGTGVYCEDTTNILVNNIIWGKDTTFSLVYSGKVSYCDIQDTIKGIGNINQSPLFDSTSTNPFSLLWNSPCIDKGNPDTVGLHLPKYDIAGNPRIVNGRVDIGAYEFQGTVNVKEPIVQTSIFNFQCYPNPVNTMLLINYQLPGKTFVSMKVLDITGREITTLLNETKDKGNYKINFNTENLNSGLYFLKTETNTEIRVSKFIKE